MDSEFHLPTEPRLVFIGFEFIGPTFTMFELLLEPSRRNYLIDLKDVNTTEKKGSWKVDMTHGPRY